MVDEAVAAIAVLLWLTAAAEALSIARRDVPEPALHMLLLTFVLLALSATFFVPAAHLASGRVTGVANLGEPIARTALNGAAWSVQMFLLRLNDPQTASTRARRRAVLLAVVVLTQWSLFLAAPVDRPTRMFTRDYGSIPVVTAYLIVPLAYLGIALIDVIRGTGRYRHRAGGSLATGLRLIGMGSWLGLGYIAVKIAFLAALARGGQAGSGIESAAGRLLALCGASLIITGSLLPLVAAHAAPLRDWQHSYRQYRKLYPLWELAYRAKPEIALDPPSSALTDALRLRDVQLRLYRRVIEIRDGRLALTPHLDTDVVATARKGALRAGLAPADADAAAEAAALLDAAHRPPTTGPFDRGTDPAPTSPDNATTLAEEIDWLLRVTRHLHELGNPRTPPTTTPTTAPPRTSP